MCFLLILLCSEQGQQRVYGGACIYQKHRNRELGVILTGFYAARHSSLIFPYWKEIHGGGGASQAATLAGIYLLSQMLLLFFYTAPADSRREWLTIISFTSSLLIFLLLNYLCQISIPVAQKKPLRINYELSSHSATLPKSLPTCAFVLLSAHPL